MRTKAASLFDVHRRKSIENPGQTLWFLRLRVKVSGEAASAGKY